MVSFAPSQYQNDTLPTIETNAGFSIYGAALAWRNDRLLKGRSSELRDRLQAFTDHAQVIGSAASGGGDRWTVAAGVGYIGAEETLYRTLGHSYREPGRTVSDVERAVRSMAGLGAAAKDLKARAVARDEALRLREEWRALLVLAKRMPRRDSDEVLEFARRSALESETLASAPRR